MPQLRLLLAVFVLSGSCSSQETSPSASVRLVTLGDSITHGVRSGVATAETFAALIQERLRDSGVDCDVVNVGIGGERTDQALRRLDDVIALQPRMVTVMYGTNDSYVDPGQTDSRISVDEYRSGLQEIVRRLLENGIEPVLMTEPRWAADVRSNGVGEHPNQRLEQYVNVCRELAEELEVPLVDHFAHWTAAESDGQVLQDWTTDGCHPNPDGHLQLADSMQPVLTSLLKPEFQPVGYRIERETILKHDDGKFLWFHPRAAAIPQPAGDPLVVMTLQKHLYTSDHYSGTSVMTTSDLGATWTGPRAEKPLDWVHENGVDIAVADVTPGWHAPSGRLLAVGAQVRYSAQGEQLEDQVRSNQTAWSAFDPQAEQWTAWRRLEMPDGEQFNMARSACAQFVVEEDGSLLLPFYIGTGTSEPFSTTVARCTFDGQDLKYQEHGNVMSLNVARGVYEPSLVKFDGRYYLTIRNDLHGYVTVSDDGLNYRPIKRWQFDDGTDLGSYNTQQHWVIRNGGLFLVYTRRGANNDHMMRHRAPLFIAQVDPQRLHVVRDTEQVLLPERGATLGNSGAASITENESWVTVSEGIWKDEARRRGADGSTLLARIRSADLRSPGGPQTMQRLLAGEEEVRVVCFGDSVTGLYYHTGGRRAYTKLLQTALQRVCPRAHVTTINAGISGNNTRQALARLDRDVLAQQPSLVTVMFGLNDLVGVPIEEYRANLTTIVDKVQAAGAEVVLCTPNAVTTTPGRSIEKLAQYCDVMRDVAAQKQVALCDCHAAFTAVRDQNADDWRLLMSDEFHPNCDGHRLIAEQIAGSITGREVSLSDLTPLRPALPHTFARLNAGQPLKVLAMQPFDQSITSALGTLSDRSEVELVVWEVAGKSLELLETEAKTKVRNLKPDLVVLAPPHSATAETREQWIRSFAWMMNWSLSFGQQEWDVVVVHPDVVAPETTSEEHADLVRRLVKAQDLTLIDRPFGSSDDAATVFLQWLQRQWKFAPAESSE